MIYSKKTKIEFQEYAWAHALIVLKEQVHFLLGLMVRYNYSQKTKKCLLRIGYKFNWNNVFRCSHSTSHIWDITVYVRNFSNKIAACEN